MTGARADLYLTQPGRPPVIQRVLSGVLVVAASRSSDGAVATLRLAADQVSRGDRGRGTGAAAVGRAAGRWRMSVDAPARCVVVTADRELAATVAELIDRMPGAELTACLEPARALAAPPACEVLLVGDHDEHPAAELAAQLSSACPGRRRRGAGASAGSGHLPGRAGGPGPGGGRSPAGPRSTGGGDRGGRPAGGQLRARRRPAACWRWPARPVAAAPPRSR